MFDRDTLDTIRRIVDNYPDRIIDVLNSINENQLFYLLNQWQKLLLLFARKIHQDHCSKTLYKFYSETI